MVIIKENDTVGLLHSVLPTPLPKSEVSTILAFPFAKAVLGRDKGRIFSLNLGPELKGIKDFGAQNELFLRLQNRIRMLMFI